MEAGLPLWKQTRLCNKDINMVMQFGTWNVCTLLQAGNWRRFANNGSKTVEKAMWRKSRMEENHWEG